MTPWPHQRYGVQAVLDAIANDERRIVLACPTGGGKTWIAAELVRLCLDEGSKCILYTGRRLMLEQLQKAMDDMGLDYGVRAAGYFGEKHHGFQIASLPTDRVRSKSSHYDDFHANLVLVDEGHLHVTGAGDRRVLDRHHVRGAAIVYVTATPIGMGSRADVLIQAGCTSELRQCGALVRARHFGPDEPAIASFKRRGIAGTIGLPEEETRSIMGKAGSVKAQRLFGRVLQWFDKLNPQRKPTILFAPGVPESRWFAEQFYKHGITAASIDGEEVWINGEKQDSTTGSRLLVREGSRDGSIQVVANRYVLREGADWPWLAHGILATVFDSLQSYLQAGGRLLRAHHSLQEVTIQDHGGNWWRHGSLNEDREWRLDLGALAYANAREEAYRDKNASPKDQEPRVCRRCGIVLIQPPCPNCGLEMGQAPRVRSVIQEDGTLVEIHGKMFSPKRTEMKDDTLELWKRCYWQMKSAKRHKNFNQTVAWFIQQHGYRPPRNLPYMPIDPYDWCRSVKIVDMKRLIPDPNYKPTARSGSSQKGLFDV